MNTTNKFLKAFFSLCLILAAGQMALANGAPNYDRYNQNWKRLAVKNVNGKFDEDRIRVGRWAGRFDAIRLKTNDDRINIEQVVIHFSRGDLQRVSLRDDWRGGESHLIRLNGGARQISHITYIGTKNRVRGRRHYSVERDREVEVWGLKASNRRNNDRYDRYDRYDDYRYDRNRDDNYYRNRNRNQNRNRTSGCPSGFRDY